MSLGPETAHRPHARLVSAELAPTLKGSMQSFESTSFSQVLALDHTKEAKHSTVQFIHEHMSKQEQNVAV